MTIRQTIQHDPNNPVDHINTGYEGKNSPEDYVIPSCGIYDADVALVELFDKELGFQHKGSIATNPHFSFKKPTVILATGEKFAVVKKLKPVRDPKTNALILPAIAIRRTSIEQTSEDIGGRGINQSTGILKIKRRLDSSDADYQNLINKLGFKHLASLPTSTRPQGDEKNNPAVKDGILLDSSLIGNNVFEVITIPQPQFITINYEVTFWTNYSSHMIHMIEILKSSQLPQMPAFRLVTKKGYWFLTYVDEIINSNENVDEFSNSQKIMQYTFNMKTKCYILGKDGPGTMVPVKRYISAPTIIFDVNQTSGEVQTKKNIDRLNEQHNPNKFVLNNLDMEETELPTPTVTDRFLVDKKILNPINGRMTRKYVKINQRYQNSRETVYTASDFTTLMEFIRK